MHVVDLAMDESVSTQQLPAPAPAPNSGKKLKQSRLPFLVLSPGTTSSIGSLQSESATSGEPSTVETRKRKPSCDGNHSGLHQAKVVRTSDRQSSGEELIVVGKSEPEVIILDEAVSPIAIADPSPGNKSAKPAGTDAEDGGSSPDKADTTVQQMVISSSEEDVYALCTPNKEEETSMTSTSEKPAAKKISAKQLARSLEHERKLALKEQERQEKRRRMQEEKEEKAREKEELERQRRKEREEREEQKRREREEREEAKRKEREEKEKKRQSEIEQKNEEKRLKEEERRRKEEEREAEEKRKQKAQAQVFSRFFVKKTPANGSTKASDDENSIDSIVGKGELGMVSDRFMPFCVKGDMRMAPVTRRTLTQAEKDRLQTLFTIEATKDEIPPSDLYLGQLKRNCIQPLKMGPTWITEAEEDDDDITIIDETTYQPIVEDHATMKQKMKAKFFLFEENRRPPYRGTWRKRSTIVRSRRPFSKDTKYFDYEVDSDDEWEEEEPGESLHGSDDEKDVDAEEDYEVDNDFFVPHGHLSDEEMQAEDEDEAPDADNSPEAQKAKLKILQQEFAAEMKKKTEKIKPRLIGCIWQQHRGEDCEDRTADCSTLIMKILNDRAMLYDPSEPISFTQVSTATAPEGAGATIDRDLDSPGKENKKAPKKGRISDSAVGDLARLVHGNVNNRKFLVREFQAFWANRGTGGNEGSEGTGETATCVPEFSMESIRNKIKEIATWGACPLEGPMHGKHCWTVDEAVLKDYNLTQLQLPNAWVYHLKGSNPSRSSKLLVPTKPAGGTVDEEN
ncbi:chromatin assembly factor 1 subunit A [Anopheles darlingi]|uniref:chromatin assembly factor 1 subunit A n=1 Tax=Anopheles darlingi TaxID=43151 RepID=UPI0021003F06|nr:chromatin assembly factor 1 subunit A [Anopheles darlingi]